MKRFFIINIQPSIHLKLFVQYFFDFFVTLVMIIHGVSALIFKLRAQMKKDENLPAVNFLISKQAGKRKVLNIIVLSLSELRGMLSDLCVKHFLIYDYHLL